MLCILRRCLEFYRKVTFTHTHTHTNTFSQSKMRAFKHIRFDVRCIYACLCLLLLHKSLVFGLALYLLIFIVYFDKENYV